MAQQFRLTIITPEKQFFDGDAEMLVLPATDGEMAVMAGHEPMVISTVEGELRISQHGTQRTAAASAGFTTVMKDAVLVMLETAEWPEDIDVQRAIREEAEAKERMRHRGSMQEYHLARAMLARAMTRLRVSSSRNLNNK